jgi:anti-sigma factor RsiW
MLTCRELVELATDYLEGALPPDERARFEAHLERCLGCASFLEQMRQTAQLAGVLREYYSSSSKSASQALWRPRSSI